MVFPNRGCAMSAAIAKNAMRLYGCNAETLLKLNGGTHPNARGSMARAYYSQRSNAGFRGVAWEITFPEWVAVWVASGRWAQRGKTTGCYCMARHGDVGPYSVANVSILPVRLNNRDAWRKARTVMSSSDVAAHRRGSGRGWSYREGHKSPYQVMKGETYVGVFKTQEEAEAAYASAP